ncbi:MAG: hypothetical protein ABIH23_13110, partial [bacterium]
YRWHGTCNILGQTEQTARRSGRTEEEGLKIAIIRVDMENNNPEWNWAAWEKKAEKLGLERFDNDTWTTSNGRIEAAARSFAETSKGWTDSGAPKYALHPLLFECGDSQDYQS